MKILVNTPHLHLLGGVANHYLGLKNYWSQNVVYNQIGRISDKQGSGKYRLPLDICIFVYKLLIFKPDVVLLNPSLSKSAVVRDMIFLRIAKMFGFKVAVFFHGFDKNSIPKLDLVNLAKNLNRCACVFVLANEFADIIRSWGVTVPIELTTTKVDDKLIKDFDITRRNSEVKNILFLARITKEKGIFIALEIFKKLKDKYPDLEMRVVGNGPALEEAKNVGVENVEFLGALSGKDLIKEFEAADLYLFPTCHAEGMPTSVLEAMAFGLPVVTRPVGGLCDFFENGKMGEMVDSFEAMDFVPMVEKYLNDKELAKQTSAYNHEYAKKHFLASQVALRLEEIFSNVIEG
jgi:glycosyltransferase involved in cell wall biosynthesis